MNDASSLPLILVADDDQAIRTVVRQGLVRAGYAVKMASDMSSLWRWIAAGEGDVVITDVLLPDENGLDMLPRIRQLRPDLPVVVMSAQNTLSTAVRATEGGAYEYLPKPFDINELRRIVESALQRGKGAVSVDPPLALAVEDMRLIGRSPAMQDVYRTMARVVGTDLTVMILGESGSGKELIARALHDLGPRKGSAFVAVNMAAIPGDLIESELFGHEKGAFTGAHQRSAGRFEQARGGTLFLDEIGDMPVEAQTRLLRVLQEGEYSTVGGQTTQRADVRIIAATHKDLRKLIEQGRFREDLYYRLNVIPLLTPPLRARLDDVPELARHFLNSAACEGLPRRQLDASALAALIRYPWPGNVRELENLMRRLAALGRDEVITGAQVTAELASVSPRNAVLVAQTSSFVEVVEYHLARYFAAFGEDLPPDGVYDRIVQEVERPLLQQALAATGGNQLRAARLLGLNRNTLRKKLTDLDVEPKGNKRPS